jgi:hypothetical protein
LRDLRSLWGLRQFIWRVGRVRFILLCQFELENRLDGTARLTGLSPYILVQTHAPGPVVTGGSLDAVEAELLLATDTGTVTEPERKGRIDRGGIEPS